MTRAELEQEIIKRMPTLSPHGESIIRQGMSLKTTAQLEDLLKRMKETGR